MSLAFQFGVVGFGMSRDLFFWWAHCGVVSVGVSPTILSDGLDKLLDALKKLRGDEE